MVSSSDACQGPGCSTRLVWAPTGRPKRYCSATCRSRAMRARQAATRESVLADVVVPVARSLSIDQVLDVAAAAGVCWCCHVDLYGVGGLCGDCRRVVDALPTVDLLPIDQVLNVTDPSCAP
jgi:hypothetical protein